MVARMSTARKNCKHASDLILMSVQCTKQRRAKQRHSARLGTRGRVGSQGHDSVHIITQRAACSLHHSQVTGTSSLCLHQLAPSTIVCVIMPKQLLSCASCVCTLGPTYKSGADSTIGNTILVSPPPNVCALAFIQDYGKPCPGPVPTSDVLAARATNPESPRPNAPAPFEFTKPEGFKAGRCNAYVPNDNTLSRFLWTVQYFIANGFYVVVSTRWVLLC